MRKIFFVVFFILNGVSRYRTLRHRLDRGETNGNKHQRQIRTLIKLLFTYAVAVDASSWCYCSLLLLLIVRSCTIHRSLAFLFSNEHFFISFYFVSLAILLNNRQTERVAERRESERESSCFNVLHCVKIQTNKILNEMKKKERNIYQTHAVFRLRWTPYVWSAMRPALCCTLHPERMGDSIWIRTFSLQNCFVHKKNDGADGLSRRGFTASSF